jgi:tRNA(Ile)-lysidine synthase
MGLAPVEVVRADVRTTGAGLEADARSARYAAIEGVADRLGAAMVFIGHTRDDQAEQVLLGLSRGSGARSLSGMPVRRDRFVRPLLALPRATTLAACAAYGIDPWDDPHNSDESFRRVRARRLLATLEADLGPGFGAALARSADLLREDPDEQEVLVLVVPPDVGGELGEPGLDLVLGEQDLRQVVSHVLVVHEGSSMWCVRGGAWGRAGGLHSTAPVRVPDRGGLSLPGPRVRRWRPRAAG